MTTADAFPLLTRVAIVDEVLDAHAAELGADRPGYQNHVYRVLNLCVAIAGREQTTVDKCATSAVFHDLGIWTDGTFDYLPPSIRLAADYLARSHREAWIPEVTAMILEHHKVSAYRGNPGWLVEPFRKADWIDVSHGVRAFGVPRAIRRSIFAEWPNAGFHKRLVQLSLSRLKSHPWSPLPMFRL